MAKSKLPAALRHVFSHRYLPVFLGFLAIAVTLLSVGQGFVADDLIHRYVLLESDITTLPTVIKTFFAFTHPNFNKQLVDIGILPWWSHNNLRISFFRPISVLTHWLDYQLWPNSAVLMHLHNLFWFGVVIAMVTLLYQRIMGAGWAAAIAALLFTLDEAHLGAVAWIANRNILLAAVFGSIALIAHDKWRRENWRAGAFLASILLILALLSAEAGVAIGAYFVAYTLFIDRGTWRQRLGCLILYASVIFIWRSGYQYLGYGAWGSGLYIDPGREPLRFISTLLAQGPILLLGQMGWPDSGFYNYLSGPAGRILWLISLLFISIVGIIFIPLLRKDRVARFWCLGMLLSVFPACSISLTDGRNLLFVGIGAMGLIALFIKGLFEQSDRKPRSRIGVVSAWILFIFFIGIHAVLAPIYLVYNSMGPNIFQSGLEQITDIGSHPQIEQQDVIIVNAPCVFSFLYFPFFRGLHDQPLPAHMRILAPGYSSVEVTRLDQNTLVIRPENGFLSPPDTTKHPGLLPNYPDHHYIWFFRRIDTIFRSIDLPMTLGQCSELTGMKVQVASLTDNQQPSEAKIKFSRPLEDASLKWLQWDWQHQTYITFKLPSIGEKITIPGPL